MNKMVDVRKLLNEYCEQNSKAKEAMYDDEIKAEADLCHECCACCRIMV